MKADQHEMSKLEEMGEDDETYVEKYYQDALNDGF